MRPLRGRRRPQAVGENPLRESSMGRPEATRAIYGPTGERRLATDDDKGREDIAGWLAELRIEHRDLDEVIEYLEQTGHPDRMKVRRMKKRKLKLKDTISRLESQLIPDLDA